MSPLVGCKESRIIESLLPQPLPGVAAQNLRMEFEFPDDLENIGLGIVIETGKRDDGPHGEIVLIDPRDKPTAKVAKTGQRVLNASLTCGGDLRLWGASAAWAPRRLRHTSRGGLPLQLHQ